MPQPRHLNRFWTAAILLAWTADMLFWGRSAGLSFPLWTLLAILALFLCAFWEGKRPNLASIFLAAGTLGLSLALVLRSEPFTLALSVLLTLSGLALLAATLLNGNWLYYRLGDYIAAGVKLFLAAIIRAAGGTAAARPALPAEEKVPAEPPAPGSDGKFWQRIRQSFPYLRGLLLALPVLLVLGSLLGAADPVFLRYFQNLLYLFDLTRLPEYLFRLFYIMVFAYIFTGLFLHAVLPESSEKRPDPNLPWNTRFLGSTESFVILSSVLILFAFFILLQLRYLFGGQANIYETGFTYSDYARRGFFELVWVAVLSLGLYLVLSAVTRRPGQRQQRVFQLLSITLFFFVLIMLASALQRLMLYEAAYGFTRLRTYTHILIPWLGVLFLAAIILEGLRSAGRIALTLFLVTFGFGLTFTILNVDGLIADLNLRRFRAGGELDSAYLADLSTDAVPVLAQAFVTERDPTARDQIGAVLACYWAPNQVYRPDWRSYNLGAARAVQALAPLNLTPYQEETTADSSASPFCPYQE